MLPVGVGVQRIPVMKARHLWARHWSQSARAGCCLSLTAQSPTCPHRPRAGQSTLLAFANVFFNIIHNIVIAKDFALQYYVHLRIQRKKKNSK